MHAGIIDTHKLFADDPDRNRTPPMTTPWMGGFTRARKN
jgi:hypothetical protein